MKRYLFQLGIHPLLSEAEIRAVLKLPTMRTMGAYLLVETPEPLDCPGLMQRLGGTVSIAEHVQTHTDAREDIAQFLDTAQAEGKIQFSLHAPNAQKLALTVKKTLKARGRSVRYIEAKNTATILHNNLIEKQGDLTLIEHALFVTRAIQPIASLGKRDFGRPGRDDKSGMLPPKLAQMMINLTGIAPERGERLLDPYCGSGTIVTEALLMGYTHVIGSDISAQAIADTRENIAWMQAEYGINTSHAEVFVSDVRDLAIRIADPVGAIVFEPYMGKPLRGNESAAALRIQANELAGLYRDAFHVFHTLLKPGGVIVGIIPQFRVGAEWVMVDCAHAIEKIGFRRTPLLPEHPSLLYHREGQYVGRRIWKFEKISD